MKTLMIMALFSVLSVSVATAVTTTNAQPEKALAYVPNGKIISQKNNEFDILTTNNTIIEIELKANGELDEASGDNITKDTFTPDQGIVGLDAVVTEINATANGGTLSEWSLDNDLMHGWHYDVEVLKGNVEYEYLLDAKTGKVISSKED